MTELRPPLWTTYEIIRKAVPNSQLVDATDLMQAERCQKSQEEIDVLQTSDDLIERARNRPSLRLAWGDTCRTTPSGTVRMGKAPHETLVAR